MLTTLFSVAAAMLAGLLLTRVVKLVHLPNVTGYLIAGLLIGPYCLNLIPVEGVEDLSIITTVALGFIAFSIGGEFKFSHIKKLGVSCIVITLFQALMATALVDVALWLAGFPLPVCLTLGAVATATAPAATLMVVRQYHAKGELTNTLLPVVAMDDAVGLMVFSISIAISTSLSSNVAPTVNTILFQPLLEIVLSLLAGVLLGGLLALSMRFFHSRANRLSLTVCAVFFGVFLAEQFSLSALLLNMATGAALMNLRADASKMMDGADSWTPPLFMLFFVLSGADLNITVLPTVGLLGVIYLIARSLGKYFGAYIGSVVTKASPNIRKYLGITLLPQAGVAIGMATLAVQTLPEYGASIQAVVLCATLVYELVGPVLTKLALTKAGDIIPERKKADTPPAA
ncbi:MAG: cation:proton antiporter [Eubacteriales bacterium]|nr:cation:proton antiporter [Eubacteriales bacterium]